jgi:hypothetical protein
VALRGGGDPVADADDPPVGVEDELVVTQGLGDPNFQSGPPDEPDVPCGRPLDGRDRKRDPDAQRPCLLSTDPRQRFLVAVALRGANCSDVVVLPAPQLDDAVAQHPGMGDLGHARRGYCQAVTPAAGQCP